MAELYNPNDKKLQTSEFNSKLLQNSGYTPTIYANVDWKEENLQAKKDVVNDLLKPRTYESVLDKDLSERRSYQEELQDRINTRNAILYANARQDLNSDDSWFEEILNKTRYYMGNNLLQSIPDEEREAYMKKLEEANKEDIDTLDVVSRSYQVALKDSNWLKRNIYAPSYSALIDIFNPTDLGDVASIGRIGSVLVSGGIGASVKGVTKGVVKGAVIGAATEGAIEGGIDILRDKSEGLDIGFGTYVKHTLLNTGGNLLPGVAAYGAKKVFKSFKGKLANAMAKASMETVGEEVQETATQAIKKGIDNNSGTIGKGEELISGTNLEDGVQKNIVDVNDDIVEGMKIGDMTSNQQAKLNEIGKKKFKDWDNLSPEEKIDLSRKNHLLEEAAKQSQEESLNVLQQKSNAIFFYARRLITELEDIRIKTRGNIQEILDKQLVAHSPAILQNVEFLISPFKLGAKKAIIRLSSTINHLSDGTLRNTADVFDILVRNGNDVIESLYKGKIKNVGNMTSGQIAAFRYVADQIREKVMKGRSDFVITEEDELYKLLLTRGEIDKYLDIIDNTDPLDLTARYTLKPVDRLTRNLNDMGFNDIVISNPELRNWAEKSVVDVSSGKKSMKLLEEEYNDFVASGDVTSSDTLLNDLKNFINNNKDEIKYEETLAKAYRRKEAIEKSRFSRIFKYYNKQDLLMNEGLVGTRVLDEGGKSVRIKYYNSKEEAIKNLSKEQAEWLEQNLSDFQKATGQYSARVEDEFWGLDYNGRRYDLRTTSVDEAYAKITGNKKSDWEKLSPEEKVKFVNEQLGINLTQQQAIKVGRAVQERVGTDDLQEIFNFYKKELELPEDYKLEFNSNGKFESYKDKNIITIDPETMDLDITIGALRHELQHAYENYHTDKKTDYNFLTKIFRNTPEIQGEVLNKIKKGKKVTLDELYGSYYGNHFYNIQTDAFETSYLAHKATQEYNKMDTFKKFQMFISAMSDTTQAKSVGRLSDTWVLQMEDKGMDLKNYIDVMKEDVDGVYNFYVNKFRSPEDMIHFLTNITEYNSANRYQSLITSLERKIRDEEVGYSLNQLFRSIRAEDLKDSLTKQGIDSKYANTMVQEYLKVVGEGIRSSLVKLDYDNKTSPTNVLTGLFARSLVGFRPFKDVYFTSANQGMQYIFNGEIKKGLTYIFKDIPSSTLALGKSFATATGELVEDTDQWINVAVKKFANVDLEPRYLAHLADGLREIGEVGEGYDTLDVFRRVSEAQEDMAALTSHGLDRNSFTNTFARSMDRSMRPLYSDDLRANVAATKMAQLEIDTMVKKTSFGELTPTQKTIYNYSGFSQEDFSKWKEYAKKELETFKNKGDDIYDISNDYPVFKSMIDGGKAIFNPTARSKHLAKNQAKNPFMFMLGTTSNLMKDCWKLINSKNIDGVLITDNSLKTVVKNIGLMSAGAVIAGSTAYGVTSVIKDSLQQRENPIKVMQSDLDDLREGIKKGSITQLGFNPLFNNLIGAAPIGLVIGGQTGTPALVSAGRTAIRSFKKGELPSFLCSIYYGAMVKKAYQIYKGDEKKVSKHIKTKKFRNQYIKLIDKRLEKDMTNLVDSYTSHYVTDARTSLASKKITLEEYNKYTNSVLLK